MDPLKVWGPQFSGHWTSLIVRRSALVKTYSFVTLLHANRVSLPQGHGGTGCAWGHPVPRHSHQRTTLPSGGCILPPPVFEAELQVSPDLTLGVWPIVCSAMVKPLPFALCLPSRRALQPQSYSCTSSLEPGMARCSAPRCWACWVTSLWSRALVSHALFPGRCSALLIELIIELSWEQFLCSHFLFFLFPRYQALSFWASDAAFLHILFIFQGIWDAFLLFQVYFSKLLRCYTFWIAHASVRKHAV